MAISDQRAHFDQFDRLCSFFFRKTRSELAMGSTASKASIGASVESTGSKFEIFDYPLDQENLAMVISHLDNMDYPIMAVWIVARPVNWKKKSKIEHWSVIIQGEGCLLLLDFLEYNNKGAFRLKARAGTDAEFDEFFKWEPPKEIQEQLQNNENIEPQKYRIVSSVTPSPLIPTKKFYFAYIDDEEKKKLKQILKQQKKLSGDDLKENLFDDAQIKCDKSIKDISDFLLRWTELKQKGKNKDNDDDEKKEKKMEKKIKPYNWISSNCQQFAMHLFEDLVGTHYADKVKHASDQAQVPMDANYKK